MAQFNNLVVERVKRTEKGRSNEFVTGHKHAFVFFTVIKFKDKEHKLKVWRGGGSLQVSQLR